MEIKLMTINDCNRVYSLWARTPGMSVYTVDDSPQGLERYLKRNPTTSFIALDDSKTIASILCGHDGRTGYVYHTCVDQQYRETHIGTELLRRSLEALKAENISRVSLLTQKNNLAGNSFWTAKGWTLKRDTNCYELLLNSENRKVVIPNEN